MYGRQAVVISVDPTRVYVKSPEDVKVRLSSQRQCVPTATHSSSPVLHCFTFHAPQQHHTIETSFPGPDGERYCWYQCTIKGGRERR